MCRRMSRILSGDMCVTSWPTSRIAPSVGCTSFIRRRPVVDLPEPDSPTSASVSPARRVKDTPSTACTLATTLPNAPAFTGKRLARPVTSSTLGLSCTTASSGEPSPSLGTAANRSRV
ncbi:hypothetical protein G6F31_018600 [Rhizopus arrhizus]|nr:hypothetical protein G6F31_018600 [Rhizopus arrhizus]